MTEERDRLNASSLVLALRSLISECDEVEVAAKNSNRSDLKTWAGEIKDQGLQQISLLNKALNTAEENNGPA